MQDLINQNFGERAGYATHISTAESGMGQHYVGDGGSSFGPFQLHYGGVNKDMPHPGLGDQFTQETGKDARDPSTVPDQIRWVADYTAKNGWKKDWTTAREGNLPSAGAQPASASTTSYGGGFALPGAGGPSPGQLDRNNLQAPTMGDELRHDPFGYMMTVGAAMASSRAPRLATGLGEGFAAGNKFLQESRDLEKQWGTAQAQINNLGAEAREHDADAGLKTVQLQIAQRMAQIQIQAMREEFGGGAPGATGAPGTIAGGIQPIQPLGGKPAAGAAPAGGAAPSGGAAPGATTVAGGDTVSDYTQDPTFLQGQALVQRGTRLAMVPGMAEYSKGLINQGQTLQEAAKARWEKTVAPTVAGQTTGAEEANKPHQVFDAETGKAFTISGAAFVKLGQDIAAGKPGMINGREVTTEISPEAAAAKEGQVKGAGKTAEEAATPHVVYDAQGNSRVVSGTEFQQPSTGFTPQMTPAAEATKEGLKIGVTQRGEETEAVANRAGDLQTEIQNLEAIRTLLKTVPTGWATTNFAEAQNVLATAGIHVGSPAEVRELVKYATSGMWQNLKEQKGAVRNKEMDAASKMNIDPDAPAGANAEILAKQLGLARLQLKYATDYNAWNQTNPGNTSPMPFKTDWMLKNDLGKYVEGERKNIAFVGQAVPPKGKYGPGQLYRLPSGKFARARDASTMTYE